MGDHCLPDGSTGCRRIRYIHPYVDLSDPSRYRSPPSAYDQGGGALKGVHTKRPIPTDATASRLSHEAVNHENSNISHGELHMFMHACVCDSGMLVHKKHPTLHRLALHRLESTGTVKNPSLYPRPSCTMAASRVIFPWMYDDI